MQRTHLQVKTSGKLETMKEDGMEGARRAIGIPSSAQTSSLVGCSVSAPPDPEVTMKRPRRNITAAYKLRILEEYDGCKGNGDIGALLRREGLFNSHIKNWLTQRENGILYGLTPKKRGRKDKPENPLTKENARLERENRKLQDELRKARIIIDVQKKISDLLGIPQDHDEEI